MQIDLQVELDVNRFNDDSVHRDTPDDKTMSLS